MAPEDSSSDAPAGLEEHPEAEVTLQPAWSVVDRVVATARQGAPIALCLDYDGTLTPIVPRPEDAVLAPEVRALLASLASVAHVAVVSGRDLEDIERRVGVEAATYAGSHGFEVRTPEGEHEIYGDGASFLEDCDRAQRLLERQLAGVEGVRVERKRFAVAVHYRGATDDVAAAARSTAHAVAATLPRLHVTEGKAVIELRPAADWHKGAIVRELVARWGAPYPVFVGDDTTDEDAFRVVSSGGAGIYVGEPRDTAARYYLESVGAVHEWLSVLHQALTSTPR